MVLYGAINALNSWSEAGKNQLPVKASRYSTVFLISVFYLGVSVDISLHACEMSPALVSIGLLVLVLVLVLGKTYCRSMVWFLLFCHDLRTSYA